jgi:CSLREA domain-containing protein
MGGGRCALITKTVNRRRLQLERLEDRDVPAPVAVDDGVYQALAGQPLYVPVENSVLNNDSGTNLTPDYAFYSALSGSYVAMNANGSFTYVPNAGFSGPDSFTYKAFDGYEYSDSATVSINVAWVNQQPSFSAMDPPETDMCADPVEVPNWASFYAGSPYESQQTVSQYIVSNVSNPSLFSVSPAVDVNGKLTYTLAPYVSGYSDFDVQVQDSGGVLNGGINLSDAIRRRLTVTGVVAPFVVNTTGDTADANPGDGRARDAQGYTSLRAAIMEANAGPQYSNPYTISFSVTGTINIGATLGALPDLAGRMNISGPGANQITIARAANAANFRIFTVRWTGGSISNVSITNGNAGGQGDDGYGGGIANFGTVTLSGVILYGNQASLNGGAIANIGPSITVSACTLYLNQAAERGGAIYNAGQAVISDATDIASNNAGSGGGIFNTENAQLTILSGSQIYANNAVGGGPGYSGRGGGIANLGTLIMSNTLLGWNTSVAEGGGLFTNGDATLTTVSIQNNQATGSADAKGGGIYVRRGTTTLVSGCTVSNNSDDVDLGGYNITWADPDGTLIANRNDNNIDDGISFDPNPR